MARDRAKQMKIGTKRTEIWDHKGYSICKLMHSMLKHFAKCSYRLVLLFYLQFLAMLVAWLNCKSLFVDYYAECQ